MVFRVYVNVPEGISPLITIEHHELSLSTTIHHLKILIDLQLPSISLIQRLGIYIYQYNHGYHKNGTTPRQWWVWVWQVWPGDWEPSAIRILPENLGTKHVWLVVANPLENMKVSWDDYPQYIECPKPPTTCWFTSKNGGLAWFSPQNDIVPWFDHRACCIHQPLNGGCTVSNNRYTVAWGIKPQLWPWTVINGFVTPITSWQYIMISKPIQITSNNC